MRSRYRHPARLSRKAQRAAYTGAQRARGPARSAVQEGADLLQHEQLAADEGLRDGCAFRFVPSELVPFVRWYEDAYRMDFFQSADYLLFDEALTYVRILHHEGALFRD